MPVWLPVPGLLDLLDILLVAIFGWLAIGYLRRTRARPALVGLAILAGIYAVANSVDLRLTATLLRGFFAVVVIVLIVVFQEDLRRVFEQLGSWRTAANATPPAGTQVAALLVRAVARMAATRTGALIVLPGREPLERHLEGGVQLGGRVSEPLLLSLFDASSPGHDGAVIVRDDTVERFAVHLPLSSNHQLLGPGGTRHAAALGLAERCDAICIAVSEERGTISVARDGGIRVLSRPEDLVAELRPRTADVPAEPSWWQRYARRDALFAILAALVLWMVLVPGSDMTERTVEVPIVVSNLPDGLELESIEPGVAEVILRARRRDLILADERAIAIHLDAYLARLGRRTFTLTEDDVERPATTEVLGITPATVRISLRPVEAEAPPPDSP